MSKRSITSLQGPVWEKQGSSCPASSPRGAGSEAALWPGPCQQPLTPEEEPAHGPTQRNVPWPCIQIVRHGGDQIQAWWVLQDISAGPWPSLEGWVLLCRSLLQQLLSAPKESPSSGL